MEGSLLVYFESIAKYYKTCYAFLCYFTEKYSCLVNQKLRDHLSDYSSSKLQLSQQLDMLDQSDHYDIKSNEQKKFLYSIDLSSKIMLCFNGELNSTYNVRMDLILMNYTKDLEKELAILQIVHKRFKKSSVAWHYRRSVFLLAFTRQLEKLKEKLKSKAKADADDFLPIKAFL